MNSSLTFEIFDLVVQLRTHGKIGTKGLIRMNKKHNNNQKKGYFMFYNRYSLYFYRSIR